MGSHLYWSVELEYLYSTDGEKRWKSVFDKACGWDKSPVADVFGIEPKEAWDDEIHPLHDAPGYLTREHIKRAEEIPEEWPWCEPYWVRRIDGAEFVAIVKEKRWRALKYSSDPERECSPELRATAAMVEFFMIEGHNVRVVCWHSQ